MTTHTSIRQYEDSDRAAILELVGRLTSFELPPWRDAAAIDTANHAALAGALDSLPQDSAVFVAERRGAFAGFIHLTTKSDYFTGHAVGYISDLAVHPDHEGKGVAVLLLDEAQAWARRTGLTRLTLEVFEGNQRAKRLYEKHGFQRDVVQYTKEVD